MTLHVDGTEQGQGPARLVTERINETGQPPTGNGIHQDG
jgi:hypothetical protein